MGPITSSQGTPVVPIWIDNKPADLDESRIFPVHNAQLEQDVHPAQGATPEIARKAADAAYSAFLEWKEKPHTARRDLLLRIANVYERRAADFVKYQVEETSCAESWASFNVKLACAALREIAANISAECTGEMPPLEARNTSAFVFKEPIGPVLSICPWNAGMVLAIRALAAPIATGCTVVFKASELSPRTHHALVEGFVEAGLPPGCINQLQARREDAAAVTEALISHPAIRKVEFVGSANVGRHITKLAAEYLKPVLLELGGKGAAIVLADADLKSAAKLCALGAFMHHGQICMSTDRIIVVKEIFDAFAQCLKDEISANWTQAGSAVSKGVAQHAHDLLEGAKRNGASYLCGDNQYQNQPGTALTPTIVSNVKPDDRLRDEETFGPSASLYCVENDDEAIKLANSTAYGLNSAVHGRDVFKALRVAKALETGQVHIGSITEYDEANIPIGGMKGSGWGRNNGKYALREFLVEKTITLHNPGASVRFGS